MSYIATAKETIHPVAQFYGRDMTGVSIQLHIRPRNRWTAKQAGGYWYLTRPRGAYVLRLTDAALRRLFDLEFVDEFCSDGTLDLDGGGTHD